ncbi:ribosomal subunit biogenesis protein [Malassezia pachydermatis]
MDLEFEMDDNESNEEEEEDSVDIETEDADDVHEEKEEADQTSTTQPTRRATIAELRERLHNKIQMLHNKRHPHDTTAKDGPSTKEELLEARRKQRGEMRDRRRRERKEARKLAKAGVKGTSTDKPTLAAGNARSAGLLVHDANGMTMTPTKSDDNLDTNLSFSQVSFETSHAPDPARKNKYALPKDPKAALASLEARKRKEEARIQKQIEGGQDAAQAREAALESERWGKALAAAEGVRIRDNVHMLKQTIKRREKSKEKSTKTWNDRRRAEQEAQAAKQKKRMENLAARRDAKKTGGKPKKPAGKPANKARPGFEGSARGFGGDHRKAGGASRPAKR